MDEPLRNILCILAGGQSSRFGSSKLRIHINGEPILAWQVRRLIGAVGRVIPGKAEAWISVSPDERILLPGIACFDHRIVDPVRHLGPLNGMHAVLSRARPQDIVTFVPADMPLLEPQHLQGYAALLAEDKDRTAVMGEWTSGPSDGYVEPLPSIWRGWPGKLLIEAAVRAGLGPRALSDRPGVVCAGLNHETHAKAWTSINRREDMLIVERELGLHVEPDAPAA